MYKKTEAISPMGQASPKTKSATALEAEIITDTTHSVVICKI